MADNFAPIIFFSKNRDHHKDKRKDQWKHIGRSYELPLFDLVPIEHGTNQFSNNDKLVQGGFGLVYALQEIMWLATISLVADS